MFFDLRIPNAHSKIIIDKAQELQYNAFAFDETIDDLKRLKSLPDKQSKVISQRESGSHYSRLTIILDNNSNLLNALPSLKYDLISVQPNTEKTFIAVCGNVDVDLISLDLSSKLPFYIKSSTVSLAISKGIFFEISYSKSIHDLNARKNLVINARNLIRATRGKNLIISSNAENAMHLRGPYDLMNLFALFGLNPDQAKAALTKNCKSLLIQAASRRQSSRGAFSVETLDDQIPSWKRQRLS